GRTGWGRQGGCSARAWGSGRVRCGVGGRPRAASAAVSPRPVRGGPPFSRLDYSREFPPLRRTPYRGPAMDLITTLAGSLIEGFFPQGWNLDKIDRLAAAPPADLTRRESWWHPHFEPVACASYEDFDTFMGHEIARDIQL